ncbi:MAG: hypothetical protein A3J93_01630 [Candidatus Magasanikbacteria bacterium RIFOXYC2_FULL_42_28]|uniref:Histidine kinase N-terminal 7TM region domain-containing protein n=1 Tax=Candidatus Magasanikbacteria bacterium RIFOXYC2_FULL_42_28 TaxID=1798704 RepID=A0A1F6NXW3_9BACT|nr:MAG: hypothetical protein A3J93_01630 [Candidatus Magasanikbacteria bacterium RIFOXYC2_FULL_42_28]
MGVVRQKQIIMLFFVVWAVSWLLVHLFFADVIFLRDFWSDTYGIVALIGGVFGLINVRACGGVKSLFGRPILFFSVGLLLETFGQIMYSAYLHIFGPEIPYPSIGDVGYFFGPVFYAAGIIYLWKIVRKLSHATKFELNALLVFFAVLSLASISWLYGNGYGALQSSRFELLLEIGYLLVGALYLALVFMLNFSSPELMAGIFGSSIRIISWALVVQYLSDYLFSIQFYQNTWQWAGIGDALYLVAYFLMILGVIRLRSVFEDTRAVVGIDGETKPFFNHSGFLKQRSVEV